MCSEAVVCLLESASRAEKAAEAVQQFVRRGFDVMDEFAICIDLFLSQEGLKLEGKGVLAPMGAREPFPIPPPPLSMVELSYTKILKSLHF